MRTTYINISVCRICSDVVSKVYFSSSFTVITEICQKKQPGKGTFRANAKKKKGPSIDFLEDTHRELIRDHSNLKIYNVLDWSRQKYLSEHKMARNRTTSKKNVQSKRLIDRVVPMDKIKKVGVAKKKTVEHTKEGFSVVNGKLVSSNDVGVLLREAQGAIDKRTNVSQRNRKKGIKNNRPHKDINSSPGWGNAHRGTDWQSEKANGMNRAKNSRNFTTNIKLQRQHFGEEIQGGSQLVISTNSDASDKLLMLFNLTLGVNQENLKNVLENISQVQIAQIRVRDLPSGSATAKVRLAYPTTQSLEKVRKLFHGALVDGRRIQVVIASDESSHLSY